MMDRNREARRAAAMANGQPRRRHRTTTGGSLRESPEDEGPLELQDTAARLRDRTVKKDRDREMRDKDRDHRERERDRLSRTKRRRGDKYREDGGVGVGGGDDDSSEESINDEDEEDDDGRVRYVPPSNHVSMSSSSPASTLTSHRKSYPPPTKVFRVAPTWKAPDEMIGVSIPRKARSVSNKRGHDSWSSAGGVTGEVSRQPSTSPVRSATVAGGVSVPSPSPARPISPSSSNVSIKKKIKVNSNGLKQRPPKPSSKSSPLIQDEIEIEVAEVLYGLMRQSQAPPKQQQDGLPNDQTKVNSRSTADSKSRVSSPVQHSPVINNHAAPLTTIAPKRKRPRPYPEEIQGAGPRSSPISSAAKAEADQATKMEAASPSVEKSLGLSAAENGGELVNSQDITVDTVSSVGNNGVLSDVKQGLVEESGGIRNGKAEEASSSPKLESPQNNDRVESSTTSTKPNSALVEAENHREYKFEIDLMAPPQTSPEREEDMAEYRGSDEKNMVTDREKEGQTVIKPKEEENDNKGVKSSKGGDVVELNTTEVVEDKLKCEVTTPKLNLNTSNFDLEKSSVNVNEEEKFIFQKQQPKTIKVDSSTDNMPGGGQSGTAPLPMSVPGGWHGGIAPMGYVGPLPGVVSMDGTPMASPPIQSPHFLFSQPKPKRCATHCYIARSISVHQQMLKMNPFWPAAAGTAPLFGGKPYNLNMVPPPTDLHAAGRGVVVNSSQDKQTQPFTFFSGQPTPSSKDKSPQAPSIPDSAQKQFLLQPALPPGAPSNILHAPALFFPMGQQQAAVPNVRPVSTKSQSTPGTAASTSTPTSAPMGAASNTGPAMSFSYPTSMGGNETQFMAILGNGAYPFPIPAHVGATPYRGTHPQAMPFFNGSFYSSQMLHPSQLQQQQAAQTSQSMQLQQQNQPNPSISTSSSSSQKLLQNQQLRPQGSNAPSGGTSNQGGLQNFQATKARTSQPHHDIGGEGSPSTTDGRSRQNLGVYGQNFAMPFNSPNFALMTSASATGGGGNNAAGVPNGNLGDKKQQQPQQNPALPMSFATINGTTNPGLDMSSIAQNHAIIMQSLPEAARQNYQIMAAQAAQHKKNNYRCPEDGKTGSSLITDTSNVDEERKAMAMRAAAASVGQSIAFSRDLGDNSTSGMPGNTVVDSSARSINLVHGSYTRPSRSAGQNSVSNSTNASNPSQAQQQMLFPKQQQYVTAPGGSSGRSKTPSTNGNIYPDHLASPSIMAAKFPNSLSGFPPLVQTSVTPAQSTQWKNSVRPNVSQVSSPSVATSTTSTTKNLPQQPGRSQQNHTQISFGPTSTTLKASSTPQVQQTQNNNQAPSSPMMMGSPSTSSVSKGGGGSPRTTASASTGGKAGGQGSTLASQQGKSSPSPSPSLSSQKQSILGNHHHIMSTSSNSGGKPQMQQSQLQAQFSKQNLQQAQLYFSNFMQQSSTSTSAGMPGGAGHYPQRHRPDTQQQQQGPGSKSQGTVGPITSSSGMLSLCNPVSMANTSTSDPAKAVAAAANGIKGGLTSQGMLHAAAQFAAQSAGGAHQLMPSGFPYVHAVPSAVQVKSAEPKQPTGE